MKVLVVGGAGYIGGAVTDALLEKKIPFTVYDSLLYEHLYLKPVDFIFGDIRDTEKLSKILPQYTHVIWLAAIVGDPACQIKPELTVAVNQDAVKWLSENYEGRIVFISTCSVYGQHDDVLDENAPTNPLSLYAQTKLAAEAYLKGKNALILRLGTVFGVSDAFSRLRMDLAVNYMTANAIKKGKLSVFGGDQWRPFIHVKDVGNAIVNNLDHSASGVYNLASFNITIKELGEIISKITSCKVEYGEQKFQDARNYRVNNSKAAKDSIFDFNSARLIEDGVKEITNLIQNGRIKYAESDVYFNERHLANLLKNNELK
ncbi:NAD(P)-dependent oxidoreductase [Candidatus Nomurabacteria bacterium]|nr:NAD(P)-dependent oxidoreductase [Candidatus Nomurabacteria bacterium]